MRASLRFGLIDLRPPLILFEGAPAPPGSVARQAASGGSSTSSTTCAVGNCRHSMPSNAAERKNSDAAQGIFFVCGGVAHQMALWLLFPRRPSGSAEAGQPATKLDGIS